MTTRTQKAARYLLAKREAADDLYEMWKKAPPSKKIAAYERYADAEGAYYHALQQQAEGDQ